jgi:hypothetical protein
MQTDRAIASSHKRDKSEAACRDAPPTAALSFAENADRDDPGNPQAAFLAERSAAATGDLALAGAAAAVIRTGGRIYYLVYVSGQPADDRFHGIRVTGSAPGVQVHARKGCYAGRSKDPACGPSGGRGIMYPGPRASLKDESGGRSSDPDFLDHWLSIGPGDGRNCSCCCLGIPVNQLFAELNNRCSAPVKGCLESAPAAGTRKAGGERGVTACRRNDAGGPGGPV